MKSVTQSTLGFAVLVAGVPSTAAEYDEMAKEVGACLDDAVENAIYRGWLNTFRSKFCEALEQKFGHVFARPKTETLNEKTGKVTVVYGRDTLYIDQLEAALAASPEFSTPGAAHSAMQEVASGVAAGLPFTLTTVRTGGKVAKEWLEAADSIIDAVTKGSGDYSKFVENITALVPGFAFAFDDAGNPTRESIAFALRARMEQKKREASDEQRALAGL